MDEKDIGKYRALSREFMWNFRLHLKIEQTSFKHNCKY